MTDSIVLEPPASKKDYPVPLCMVFHGNDSNPQAHAKFWRPLCKSGWLVALPQSSRAGEQPDTYSWNTSGLAEWDFQEARKYFTEIKLNYRIDSSKTILAGFSMGGGLTIEMALSGLIASLGFIAVAPYIPYKYVDPQSNYSGFVKTKAARGYCIVGEQDFFALEGAYGLASRLPNIGIPCVVEQHPDLEHDYPSEFATSLLKAVHYVSSK